MNKNIHPITNEFGQPIGLALKDWRLAQFPSKKILSGSYCKLEPLEFEKHGRKLFNLFQLDPSSWTYLPYGPFDTFDDFSQWLIEITKNNDPFLYAILDNKTNKPLGIGGYCRINQNDGSIEIGHLHFSKYLQQTRIATEAMYLLMQQAFEVLGYRRYEWKCDSLNYPSRKAAERLGFKFEGIFRQDRIYKNRSRDTAWFSIIDSEWSSLKSRFQKWLSPENFDEQDKQHVSLKEITKEHHK